MQINNLLGKFLTKIENDTEKYDLIISQANSHLKNFLETITLVLDKEDFSIKITDESRGLHEIKNIKKYFNEAKINLVILLVIFSAIEANNDHTKKNILILDDFITSLDMANRTFLVKYVLDTFKDFQIVIFTHSIVFYNLIMYLINQKICNTGKKWKFANLYEADSKHKIYYHNLRESTEDIRTFYVTEKAKPTPDFALVGNKLRQKFERILYEFSKILAIGGVEESNKILEYIDKHSTLYLRRNGKELKNCNDLVIELESVKTIEEIKATIATYKISELPTIKTVLKNLTLYRKVTMHPLSHGKIGAHAIQPKEIESTLLLLEKLEKSLKDLLNDEMDG